MGPEISATMVKELRARTGGGIMDCKRALVDAEGNIERAVAIISEAGLAKAAHRSGRATGHGVVDAYIHSARPLGALIELGCEIDFVARTDEFRTLAHEIAMHVAATKPASLSVESLAPEMVQRAVSAADPCGAPHRVRDIHLGRAGRVSER